MDEARILATIAAEFSSRTQAIANATRNITMTKAVADPAKMTKQMTGTAEAKRSTEASKPSAFCRACHIRRALDDANSGCLFTLNRYFRKSDLNRGNLSPNETTMPDSLSVIHRMGWEAKAGTGCWGAKPSNLAGQEANPKSIQPTPRASQIIVPQCLLLLI